MCLPRIFRALPLCTLAFLAVGPPAPAEVLVGTQHNDNYRTGAYTRETLLTPDAVANGTGDGRRFHKLFECVVDPISAGGVDDSQIVAQPLYVRGVTMAHDGRSHDVVYVATMHNTVFAFDANDGTQQWATWLGRAVQSHYDSKMDGWQTNPEWGILSTPVIDEANGVLYVVTWNGHPEHPSPDGSSYRLHALPLNSGVEAPGSAVTIEGSVDIPNTSPSRKLPFKPSRQKQRPGLLLLKPSPQALKGNLFIAFGASVEPIPANTAPEDRYRGWVIAYDVGRDSATGPLKMTRGGAWCSTPRGQEAGIWQSGTALAADKEGSIYLATGNGSVRIASNNDRCDLGNACVKLAYSGGSFRVADWFIPQNWQQLNKDDADLGSGGPVVIPDSHLLILGGKEGKIYLIDGDNMGHSHDPDQVLQAFQVTHAPDLSRTMYWNLHGSPVFWVGPDGPRIYAWGEEDNLKVYGMKNTGSTASGWRFSPTEPLAKSKEFAPIHPPQEDHVFMPGGMLSLSANGTCSGILWALVPLSGNANRLRHVPGVLRAYDASQFVRNGDGSQSLKEIWNSERTAEDRVGNFAKFCPPTIADGKVFVATYSGKLVVYGLKR